MASHFESDPNILNPELFDTSDIEVNFYQQRLAWPWRRGHMHALAWTIFALCTLAIFGLLHLHDLRLDSRRLKITIENRRNRGAKKPLPRKTSYDRVSTHVRAFAYLRGRRVATVSVGMMALIVAGVLFPMLYAWTQRPYYAREPRLGPPPLAGRAGMMAVAMLPFVLALAMKWNLVAIVSGVGHEKLNVLHRWLGWLMGLMSLIHALPYFVEMLKEGGRDMVKQKFRENPVYWNGVAALCFLFWLCVASLPFIRAYCYELFVHTHIIAAIGFVAMLFWHCNNMLTSWHYLIAACAIWGGCLLWRLLAYTNFWRACTGEKAHIALLSDGGVRISVLTTLRWSAGQHVFIRIPSISLLDNHPFTVASFPEKEAGEYNSLELVFKPHSGFTNKVRAIASRDPDNTVTAFLDGPYGGLARPLESFDTVVLIAGGSGITPVVGHLAQLARKIRNHEAVTKDVRIIWTVKHFESLEWFKDHISLISRSMPRNTLLVQYFVTQETPVELPSGPVSATREWPATPILPPAHPFLPPPTPFTPVAQRAPAFPAAAPAALSERAYEMAVVAGWKELGHAPAQQPRRPLGDEVLLAFGRPPLGEALRGWAEGFGRRACIYVCGPASMKAAVSNAAAEMQTDIWHGDDREEVYLHTESFGW